MRMRKMAFIIQAHLHKHQVLFYHRQRLENISRLYLPGPTWTTWTTYIMSTTTFMATTATTSSATATCTTAVPGKYGRVPVDACNSNYFFDPNFGANLAFCVLFGFTTIAHLVQAVLF